MNTDFYNETYVGNALNGLSQLGNWISGGRADISISARVGFNSFILINNKYYKLLETIIDNTFYPIEGQGHCIKAYEKDPNEDYNFDKGGKIGFAFIFFISVLFCIPLSIIFWTYYGIVKIF